MNGRRRPRGTPKGRQVDLKALDEVRALLRDLRGMGEANLLLDRLKQPTRRTIFARAAALYQDRHADKDGRLTATFQVLFLTGWAPDPSQQQPARRGSGKTSLKDFLS